ncbi:MAG: DNA methyltransferase [Candidatus Thorarchaeota archaeon]
MDFIYKKSGTMFNMHSYWTKQPVDVVEHFIKQYSNEQETVLDPFCGTGIIGVAAIRTNRNIILNDISPICLHISKGYCTNFNVQQDIFKINKEKIVITKDLDKYYQTKCSKCGDTAQIKFSIVEEKWENEKYKNKLFKEFSLLKICYKCGCSKKKQYKIPNYEDLKLFNVGEFKNYFYPKDELIGQEPKRNYKRGIKKVYQLYSFRNLSVLCKIFNRIMKLSNQDSKQLFLFIFTSILFNSSLMSRYREYENTSIKMGTFYIPPLIKDTNVVTNFLNKFNLIIKGNAEIFSRKTNSQVMFLQESADELKSIKPETIDYIYTDPPYSDIINYSELNIVFESWLGSKTNIDDEMIVSSHQKKDIYYYARRFEEFLKKCYIVLKSNKYLTIIFHHPNIEHWKLIQKAFVNSKFEPILSETPIRLVSKSKTSSQYKTKKPAQCFLVFNLRKNIMFGGIKLEILEQNKFEELINKFKKEAIEKGFKQKSDLFDFLINKLIFKYEIHNFIL